MKWVMPVARGDASSELRLRPKGRSSARLGTDLVDGRLVGLRDWVGDTTGGASSSESWSWLKKVVGSSPSAAENLLIEYYCGVLLVCAKPSAPHAPNWAICSMLGSAKLQNAQGRSCES